MYYKPDGDFEMRELTAAEEAEYLANLHASTRYAVLSMVAVLVALIFLAKHRWGYALAVWILANVSSMFASHYRKKARETGL